MTTNVDQAELEALRESTGAGEPVQRPLDVTPRDFAHPRTLSKERLRHVSKSLSARLGALAHDLAGPLRNHHKVQLGEVSEVTAHGLFDGFVKPFVVLGFPCADRQGWLVWESTAAATACEIVLSGPQQAQQGEAKDQEPSPTQLSRGEGRVVASLLDHVVRNMAEPLNLEVGPGELWQEPEELTTLEDLGPDADSRRLLVHLLFEGPSGPSELRLYLPGVIADDDRFEATQDQAPPHLAGVGVRLSVELGAAMVPLSELLGLEVGDVVPLDAHTGDLVAVRVEDHVRARAVWGSSNGRVAIRIDHLSSCADEDLTPED